MNNLRSMHRVASVFVGMFHKNLIAEGDLNQNYGNPAGSMPPPPPPLPPSPRSETESKKTWILIVMVVVVLVALVLAVLVLVDPFGKKETSPAAAPTTMKTTMPVESTPPGSSSLDSGDINSSDSGASSAGTAQENALDAGKQLEALRVSQSGGISAQLMGGWAAQLASTKKGVEDAAYLQKHQSLDAQYGTFLSTTDDFFNKRETGDVYWVTFVSEGFSDKSGAEMWCESHQLDSTTCLVREMKP